MALGSKNSKQPTRAQILQSAAEQDGRRQEQIRNQTVIINRLLEVNQHYEGTLQEIGEGIEVGAPQLAREALDKAAEINKRHRQENNNG